MIPTKKQHMTVCKNAQKTKDNKAEMDIVYY